jgi:hypothetical protein
MPRSIRLFAFALLAALAAPARADEAAPAPISPEEVEHVRALARELEHLRGATFTTDVGVERQTTEGFRAFVARELDKSLPPDEAAAQSKALQAFGLLPAGYDLRKGLLDLYVSQAGAYYDPETKKFYLLLVDMPKEDLDGIILHELAHALQDQRFDLRAAIAKAHASKNDDEEAALQHLVEGEATFLMVEKQLAASGVSPDQLGGLGDTAFASMRDLDRPTLLANAELAKKRMGPQGDEVKKAIDALAGIPDILFWGLYGPYMRGQWDVYKTRGAKGWAGVDELFRHPPTSTEQVLHPEKAYEAKRDEPVAVEADELGAALGPAWHAVRANTLGEAAIRVLFEAFLPKHGAPRARAWSCASGWGGDRYTVYEGPEGRLALFWHTKWDAKANARRFADALHALERPHASEAVYQLAKEDEVWFLDAPEEAVKKFKAAHGVAQEAGK